MMPWSQTSISCQDDSLRKTHSGGLIHLLAKITITPLMSFLTISREMHSCPMLLLPILISFLQPSSTSCNISLLGWHFMAGHGEVFVASLFTGRDLILVNSLYGPRHIFMEKMCDFNNPTKEAFICFIILTNIVICYNLADA